jgi:hypothetical protein
MSHFYYIHRDVGGDPEFQKPGITVHPSNVVRGIQRKQSKKFVIDHLYFGRHGDILLLEEKIKMLYKKVSGKVLLEWGNQTELFKVNMEDLVESVNMVITRLDLDIVKIPLAEPYHGTNQSTCSLKIPFGERDGWYFYNRALELFGPEDQRTRIASTCPVMNPFEK